MVTKTKEFYLITNGDEVEKIGITEEEVIQYTKLFKKDFLENAEVELELRSEYEDFEIKDLDSAKKFLSEFEIYVVSDEDTECSLLLKRMLDKDEKCYFKIKTKEYDYSDQGFWEICLQPLIYNDRKREMKIQLYATKHCPSGLWDNGIEKVKHYTICPYLYKDLDKFLKEIVRWLMASQNYKIENWHIK